MWADLGRALAALHAMPVPTGARWRRPNAMGDLDIEQIGAFWSTSLPEVARLLDRRCVLGEQMRALPPVFVHGDCHTENVTVADGALVFCDWQSAGIGRRSGDLAFLSVRATPAGVSVPPVLLDAYERNSSCDPLLLRRAVIAEELAILVFEWPNYAAFANAVGIARVQRRTRELARQWLRTEALTAEPPGA
jgi:aminoglycoside phosphotransferase (APT) family kinase protein